MFIDCYLFSEITQQIGHTYYSGLNHYHRILYFNLYDFSQDGIPFKMFIYKVKVDSNDVYNLFQIGVRAVKYQVIEEVPFGDFVKEATLSKKTKKELMSILNGTMSENKIVKIYADSIEKGSFNLTKLQILKLHAVLAQTKYELPALGGGPQTIRFLPLVEYYGKKYELNSNLKSYAKKSLEYNAMQGSKKFEYIKNEDVKELTKTSSDIMDLIRCRKLTQEQFEDYCIPMKKAPYKLNEFEQRKILAYLSYKYDLSIVEIEDESQLEYIKLLEYYKRQYSISEFSTFDKTSSKCEVQRLRGTKKFEIISNRSPSELVYNVWLNDYIISRQLTQAQFNQLCEYIKTEELSMLLGFVSNSIKAGYEILPEYRELFFPYVLYHVPTKNLDLLTKKEKLPETAITLFHCGYKLKNYDYNNIDNYNKTVVEAKTIFQNGFKYINKQV